MVPIAGFPGSVSRIYNTLRYIRGPTRKVGPVLHLLEAAMLDIFRAHEFQESKIEEEPILGRVLVMPGGRVQTLTFIEKVLVTLGLTNAKRLEARYAAPRKS
jgi:hypothetical protein